MTAAVSLACSAVVAHLREGKIPDLISVKKIISPDDEDITRIIELYVELFSDESLNYSSEDIIGMIQRHSHDHESKNLRVEDFVLVAKYNGAVVGFLFCHFFLQHRKAIISYYGIDKSVLEARRSAANVLLKSIRTMLCSNGRKCDYLFFEVERPGIGSSKEENVKRKARISVFKQGALAFGLKANCLRFDYTSPRITLSAGTEETPLTLMVISFVGGLKELIPRALVIEFLRFIYLECYGDIYETSDFSYSAYQIHLREKLSEYEEILPDEIEVV